MFCLLFTIPADKKQSQDKKRKIVRISRIRRLITWVLMLIWLFLILFAFIAASDPEWLKNIATVGRLGESKAMVDYGDNFLRQRNYRMAIPQYQKALKIKPDHTGALVNMAIAYSLSGDHSGGLQVLRKALKQATSRQGTIFFNMADIFRRQGENETAIEYYKKSIGSEVEQDLVYQRLGSLYVEMGRLDDAFAAFEKTLEIQTGVTNPYVKMLKRALPFFEGDSVHTLIIEDQLSRGVSVGDLAAYDLTIIESINAGDPEIAKTHNFLGAICADKENIDKAIEHFESSLNIWPGNIDAKRSLSILRQKKAAKASPDAGS